MTSLLNSNKHFLLLEVALCCFLVSTASSGDPNESGLKAAWGTTYHNLRGLYANRDPKAMSDVSFYLQLAKAAYHVGELAVGVEVLEGAIPLDPSRAVEIVGMQCDLYYHMSQRDATVLDTVAKCLRRQFQIGHAGSKEVVADPAFWSKYSGINQELGRYSISTAAAQRAVDTSAAAGEGGSTGLPDPQLPCQLAKALLKASRFEDALAVLGPRLDGLRSAMEHGEATGDWRGLFPHKPGRGDGVAWVADAWHDSGMAHWKLGRLGEALYDVQVALSLNPDMRYTHSENYHQSLARIYLECGRLDLARAALWGIADLNHATLSPSAFRRRGFQEAADQLKTRQHQSSAGSDEVLLHELALTSASDPAMYFLLAELSPAAQARGIVCVSTDALALDPGDSRWGSAAAPAHELRGSKQADEDARSVLNKYDGASDASVEVRDGALVYLCCADESEFKDLSVSLGLLRRHFIPLTYPVFVLHDFLSPAQEKTLTLQAKQPIASGVPSIDLRLIWLAEEQWQRHAPVDVPTTDKLYGYGFGYRHMCRFFSGPPLAAIPALQAYNFLMRFDTDSFLLGPVESDPIREMRDGQYVYGWIGAFADQPYFTTGLWAATKAWLLSSDGAAALAADGKRTPDAALASVHTWIEKQLEIKSEGSGDWDTVQFCFATNIFVVDTRWWRGRTYRAFFDALDDNGGIYRHRWGDACIHFLAVAALLDRDNDVVRVAMPYFHQGTVILPEYPGLFSNGNF